MADGTTDLRESVRVLKESRRGSSIGVGSSSQRWRKSSVDGFKGGKSECRGRQRRARCPVWSSAGDQGEKQQSRTAE